VKETDDTLLLRQNSKTKTPAGGGAADGKKQCGKVKFFLESLGCAKNQVDSELLIPALINEGWIFSGIEEAGIILVNSCAFIKSSKQESINTVISFKRMYSKAFIVLFGCLAARYGEELRESLSEADLIIASLETGKIVQCLKEHIAKWGFRPGQPDAPFVPGRRTLLSAPGTAYIKIAEGCNNFCSFCAIPYIRGALRSRSIGDIKGEIMSLLEQGAGKPRGGAGEGAEYPVREFCLIAQDSASFGFDIEGKTMLPALLKELVKIKGDFRVRILYLHPDHFPGEILDIMRDDSRILPYFDIPFQHSSRKILNLMKRTGAGIIYLNLIEKIRKALPDAVLRSTFLTGFPGEDEDDFNDLLDFQREAGLDWLGVFTYSGEDGTEAYNLKERVGKKIAALRKSLLEEHQIPITEKRLDRYIGTTQKVLVEGMLNTGSEDRAGKNIYLARGYMHAPEVDGLAALVSAGKPDMGDFCKAKITARKGFDLTGTIKWLP